MRGDIALPGFVNHSESVMQPLQYLDGDDDDRGLCDAECVPDVMSLKVQCPSRIDQPLIQTVLINILYHD